MYKSEIPGRRLVSQGGKPHPPIQTRHMQSGKCRTAIRHDGFPEKLVFFPHMTVYRPFDHYFISTGRHHSKKAISINTPKRLHLILDIPNSTTGSTSIPHGGKQRLTDLLSGDHYDQYDPDKNAGPNPFLKKSRMRAGLLVNTF